jgi:hypothetical protein
MAFHVHAQGWRLLQTKLTWFVMALSHWRARRRPSFCVDVRDMFALDCFSPLTPIGKLSFALADVTALKLASEGQLNSFYWLTTIIPFGKSGSLDFRAGRRCRLK